MDKSYTIKNKKNWKLPAFSLSSGIISFSLVFFTKIIRWSSSLPFHDNINLIIGLSIAGILGVCMPIISIVCGSIDLEQNKNGVQKNKVFKSMDILGIVFGSIILFITIIFILGDILLSDR